MDPRLLLRRIPEFLAERYGVKFYFGCAVQSIDLPRLETGTGTWTADAAIVCSGDDFESLYAGAFAGLMRTKTQTLRTEPQPGGWRLGPT